MQISREDLAFIKTTRKIVNEAKFEVEGQAVATVAACLRWMAQLEGRFEKDLETGPPELVKEPIEQMRDDED